MPCPICKKNIKEEFKPFCSKKCQDIDLLKWLSDDYVLPSNRGLSEEELEEIEQSQIKQNSNLFDEEK